MAPEYETDRAVSVPEPGSPHRIVLPATPYQPLRVWASRRLCNPLPTSCYIPLHRTARLPYAAGNPMRHEAQCCASKLMLGAARSLLATRSLDPTAVRFPGRDTPCPICETSAWYAPRAFRNQETSYWLCKWCGHRWPTAEGEQVATLALPVYHLCSDESGVLTWHQFDALTGRIAPGKANQAQAQGEGRAVRLLIPPGHDAQLSPTLSAELQERNRNIRSSHRLGRREWHRLSGIL